MGATLSYAGPQLGQAAQGFVQGRQLATQEDTQRQNIALRAAEEGRQKELHRMTLQQLGLNIQNLQQNISQNEQMFPRQLEAADNDLRPGDQVSPDFWSKMGFQAPPGDITTNEAMFLKTQEESARRAAIIAGSKAQSGDDSLMRTMLNITATAKRSDFDNADRDWKLAYSKYDAMAKKYVPGDPELDTAIEAVKQASQRRNEARARYNDYIRQFGATTGFPVQEIPEDELESPF